jgi:diamine N-acetyltransferase
MPWFRPSEACRRERERRPGAVAPPQAAPVRVMARRQQIELRLAAPADAAPLARFAARLFQETYGAFNRPDDIRDYVSRHFLPSRLAADLADPDVRVVIGELGQKIVGYGLLRRGPAPQPLPGREPAELARLYVDPTYHGHGIAARLLERCIEEARLTWDADLLWLSVWKENPRAVRFYEKQGFRVAGSLPFSLGADVQEDHLMILPLPRPAG